jgi:hypothetical protein
MHEHFISEKQRKPVRRRYRKTALEDLGWIVVRDDEVYAPGEDREHHTDIWNLEMAARQVGLPRDLDDLYVFMRALRDVYVRGSSDRSQEDTEDLYASARMALGEEYLRRLPDRNRVEAPRAADPARTDVSREGRATYPAVEAHLTRRTEYLQDTEVRQALRLESELVQQFANHLEEMGHTTSGVAVPVGKEASARTCSTTRGAFFTRRRRHRTGTESEQPSGNSWTTGGSSCPSRSFGCYFRLFLIKTCVHYLLRPRLGSHGGTEPGGPMLIRALSSVR